MAGIQLSGLVSGLDTQTIITQLMTIERQPRTRIELDQSATQKRQSLLQDISAKVTTLKTAADALKSTATWIDTQTATSADESKVSIIRTGGAPPGGYDISISQLASAERQTYAFQTSASASQLAITNQDGSARTTVSLAAGATIDDAVAAINSSTDAGVYAVNVNGALVLAAKGTGAASGFSVTGAGAQTDRVAGQDALFSIGTTSYQRSTNVVSDALPGTTLTLKGKTSGTDTVGVTVSPPGPDVAGVTTKIQAFVDAYNALVTTTRADLNEKRVPGAATTADVQRGTLFGDTGLSSMLSSLRSTVGTTIAGLTGLTSLADIGISTGAANTGAAVNQDAVDGKLTIDKDKLTAALQANPLGVRTLLGGTSGINGFAQAFSDTISPFAGAGGILDQRISSATSDLSTIADKLTDFDARMDMKQDYYQKQFTALETAMQASQTQTNALAGLISSSGS
jgi:flagellar hook-associated protein 2